MDESVGYDPLKHAAAGRDFSTRGDWPNAVVSYQKALACMPELYGVHTWFQEYLLDGNSPAMLDSRQHAAIYAELARALMALDRRLDARITAQSALRIDSTNPAANAIMAASGPDADRSLGYDYPAPYSSQPETPAEGTTVVFTTHCTTKLVKYRELAPPSTNLIAACYGSLLQTLGEGIMRCPRLICLDMRPGGDDRDAQYARSLKAFCRRHGFDLVVFEGSGLRTIWETALRHIRTATVLLVEHDWLFKGPSIDLGGLTRLFDQYPGVNSVRFNQRPNLIARYDFLLEAEPEVSNVPLMRTPAFSNNPALFRTSILRDHWLPACRTDPVYSRRDLRSTAYGIEEPLFRNHIADIRRLGFEGAHGQWGAYIYGSFGDAPRIVHLGE